MELIFNIFIMLLGIASCLAITSLIVLMLIGIIHALITFIKHMKE